MSEPSTPPPRRRRRVLLILAAAVVLLPLLLVLAGVLSLRSGAVRRSVLDRISTWLAAEYGLALQADDFEARWGGFSLDGVRVGAPGAAPLLTASRVDAAVDMRTLRSPVRVIRALEIDDPRLDLTAPVPKLPEGGPPGFEVRRLVLRRGSITGPPPEAPLSEHLRSWRVDEVEGGGSFVAGLWDLSIESSRLGVERPGFDPLSLQVSTRIGYREGEPLQIVDLRAAGDGLRLTGSGTVGLAQGAPSVAAFDVQAEPRLLVAGTPPGGSVRARGNLRLPGPTGQAEVGARDVPAEMLRPYLDSALFRDLSLAGTVADGRADLMLDHGVTGEGEGTWRRRGRELVRMDLGVTPGDGDAIRLTAEGDLLPGSPGRRHLRGTIEAAGWTELASATAEQVRAEVRLPDVRAALAEIRSLWPRLVPAIPEGVEGIPVQGSLAADVRLSGKLASPLAKVDATWLPEPGSRVHLTADGRPATWTGSARAEVERLDLGLFGPGGEGSGTLEISGSPRSYRTKVNAEVAGLSYPPYQVQNVRISADGSLKLRPLTYTGTLDLDGTGLDAPDQVRAERFDVHGDGTVSQAGLSGSARLDAWDVEIPAAEATLVDLHAEATGDGREVRVSSLSGSLPEGRTFAASGRFSVEPLLDTADLTLKLVRPVDPVREAELTAVLRQGVVELDAPRIDTDAGPASVKATVPLGALAQVPALAETLKALPIELAPGLISVQIAAPSVDSQTLLAALGQEPRPERLRAGVSADLVFDPAAPAAGRGEARLVGLVLDSKDGHVAAEEPMVARLEAGRLELRPVRLRVESGEIGATSIDFGGVADLDPAWSPFEDPPEAVVRNLSAQAGGTLDAALLNPFLEGGAGSGALTFSASASGTPGRLGATFSASGPEASVVFPAQAVRLEGPALNGSWSEEGWSAGGSAELNGGEIAFGARPSPEGGALVSASLDGVHYRLEYGLTTRLSGLLSVQIPLPLTGETRLGVDGTVQVDRGVLVQDINLDREVLTLLTAPEDTPGTEPTFADRIDLDLNVTTRDGIRVRNNVADLRAHWDTLRVNGTAEAPEVRGRVEIDPGGLLYIYGQTARVDRGTLTFTGNPVQDPRIELATTTSVEDPTLAQLRGPLGALDQPEDEDGEEPEVGGVVTSGLASYYGARAVSRLGESVGLRRFTLRPVLVFGETDPSARLTVGGDLSRHASFAFSLDLRNSERRTWLVDLHGFTGFPGMILEGFTTDLGGEGASLQQAMDFGGTREAKENLPRLRRLRLQAPPGISKRRLRRAIRLHRKDPVPEETAFEVEIDLGEHLHRRGYPGAQVTAETVPVEGRPGWVDVDVSVVQLGPQVEFAFEGDRPPRAFRSEIAAAYRVDFYEERSLEEMKAATVRAFRSAGHLDPQVAIEVLHDGLRTVTIRTEAGPRVKLEEMEVAGIDPGASRLVAQRFPGTLSRAELAAGLPGADRHLLDALIKLGYPRARIAGREVSQDGSRLTVRVEPGERQVFGAVELTGVEGEEREQLAALIPVHAGEPVRVDLAAEGAFTLERSLKARGYPDATVRGFVDAPLPGRPLVRNVRYVAVPGPRVRLAEVVFEGERWTRPVQLAKAAGLKPGAPLDSSAVSEARMRLYRTGAFSRVAVDVDRPEEGEARVTFSLVEKPRFHLGYGVRWENGTGTAAVVDAIDSNFLGRGLTLGLRALYEPKDRSARLFLRTGGLFGTKISLETYALARHQRGPEDDNFLTDTEESALQFARPFGRRTTGRVYFRYRKTHFFEEEPDPYFPLDTRTTTPYMGMQILRDSRDDLVDPTRGMFRSLDLSGSGPFLGSDFDYARLYGQVSLYRSFELAGRPLVWAQSVRSGAVRAFSGQALVKYDRFLTGGEASVRGYDTETLGIQERNVRKESLLVLNQELRVRLPWDGLTGLVFFDAGQVWADDESFGSGLAKSLGLGLRVRTPVGLLRFDAAYPIDRRPGDESYKLYFGFGNAF